MWLKKKSTDITSKAGFIHTGVFWCLYSIMSNFSFCHKIFNFTQWQYFHYKQRFVTYLFSYFQNPLLQICCMWERVNAQVSFYSSDPFIAHFEKDIDDEDVKEMSSCTTCKQEKVKVNICEIFVLSTFDDFWKHCWKCCKHSLSVFPQNFYTPDKQSLEGVYRSHPVVGPLRFFLSGA